MRIELKEKTRAKIIQLIQQRQMIENEINLICSTILEVEEIEAESFKLNNEITHIEIEQ